MLRLRSNRNSGSDLAASASQGRVAHLISQTRAPSSRMGNLIDLLANCAIWNIAIRNLRNLEFRNSQIAQFGISQLANCAFGISQFANCAIWNLAIRKLRNVEFRNSQIAQFGISQFANCAICNFAIRKLRNLEFRNSPIAQFAISQFANWAIARVAANFATVAKIAIAIATAVVAQCSRSRNLDSETWVLNSRISQRISRNQSPGFAN